MVGGDRQGTRCAPSPRLPFGACALFPTPVAPHHPGPGWQIKLPS
jgi:hypothetical protein